MNKPHPAPARKVEHGTFTRCPVCLQAVVLRDQQTNHDVVVNLRQYNALQKVLDWAIEHFPQCEERSWQKAIFTDSIYEVLTKSKPKDLHKNLAKYYAKQEKCRQRFHQHTKAVQAIARKVEQEGEA